MRKEGYYQCNVRGSDKFGPARKVLCYFTKEQSWFIPGYSGMISHESQYVFFSSIDELPTDVDAPLLTPADITDSAHELSYMLTFLADQKREMNCLIANIDKRAITVGRMLSDLRSKCKHTFPDRLVPSMMGRGTCTICGYDDY